MPKKFTLIDFWRKVQHTCVIKIMIIVIHTGTVSSNVFGDGHSAIKTDANAGKLDNNRYYILPLTNESRGFFGDFIILYNCM